MREAMVPSARIQLEAELLRHKASLADPETGLPTLAALLHRLRRMLDQHGSLQVFVLRIEQEKLLEGVLGWELYDSYVAATARFLAALIDHDGHGSTFLCQENVYSDVFLLFTSDTTIASRIHLAAGDGIPVTHEPAGLDALPLRVGQGRVWRNPAMRAERCIYGGILDARNDFHRRGEVLDERRRQELRMILRDRSVRTFFQPILRTGDRSPEGFEALSRGPSGSYLEPAENLFGFAERAGTLGEVEHLCVERALVNAAPLPAGSTLFINLSIHGLEYIETVVGGLAKVSRQGGWPSHRFVLEITERTYADSPERLKQRVTELRGQGFRIAIDDMGTGYSSLSVLTELEPEYIKLDRTLVRDLATKPIKRNLVAAISGFAVSARSRVIAEGVETEADFATLAELGIDLAQGYYFGLPAKSETFASDA